MTSFSSVATPKNDQYSHLVWNIFLGDEFAVDILDEAKLLGYFKKEKDSQLLLRKLVAYLLTATSDNIVCLIVDEANNYKLGIASGDYDHALRNELTARFLGTCRDKILTSFPRLQSRVKFPLAEKIICLSATPKDRHLLEIKNQFNCFTKYHILSNAKTVEEVESKLKNFLIRGNLEYKINGGTLSRNQCRLEHRLGNVNKSEKPEQLVVEDNFNGIFWQLLQYQSIRHLGKQPGASFEIGMLAGFESYQIDIDKTLEYSTTDDEGQHHEEKEYELTAHRKIKDSQDGNIIRSVIDSYIETFQNELPPHPKQSRLEDEILRQMMHNEKSLIFVRRIATAYELEHRLLRRYEREVVVDKLLKLSGPFSRFKTEAVSQMLREFHQQSIKDKKSELFEIVLSRSDIKQELFASLEIKISPEDMKIWLRITCQHSAKLDLSIEEHIKSNKKYLPSDLREQIVKAMKSQYPLFLKYKQDLADDIAEVDIDERKTDFFFNRYFRKEENGFYYRTKMYRENWFDINLLELNNGFRFLSFNAAILKKELMHLPKEKGKKKHQVFEQKEMFIREWMMQNARLNPQTDFVYWKDVEVGNETTFVTQLLKQYCAVEFSAWIERHRKKQSTVEQLLLELNLLDSIIKNIFRNGSGLLVGFIADACKLPFSRAMMQLLTAGDAPFGFVLKEVKTIINDFELLININFPERDVKKIANVLRELSPVNGTTGIDKTNKGLLAARFRMPGYPYVLVTTDIFREGEDLHTYCQNIYHYGIAWNPSDMEQRTGRIDRINSLSYRKLNQMQQHSFENLVHIFYPYLKQSVEVNQVVSLLSNLDKFIETFNDIDISNDYDTRVKVDWPLIETDIPEQIRKRLKSKYDVWDFAQTRRKLPVK